MAYRRTKGYKSGNSGVQRACGRRAERQRGVQNMDSYNYDRNNLPIPSQAGYTAETSVNGYTMGVGALSSPSDIFHAGRLFWIADTGNDRIIAAINDFSKAMTLDTFTRPDGTQTSLKSPTGVFVSGNIIYIADSGNSRIIIADSMGNVVNEITKPDSVIYDSNKTFVPQKVLADGNGNIYVVLNNITSGTALFSADCEFRGFFGADRVNRTSDALRDYLAFLFVSDSKRSRQTRSIPTGIANFDIDGDFIFTCSPSSVRRLNPSGDDIFESENTVFGDYKPLYDTSGYNIPSADIVDLDVSADDYINCLDRSTGRIFQYDSEGNLIFIIGGEGKQSGLFQQACAVESVDGRIYVLDSMKNSVTVFAETEFGRIVHQANDLCNDGYYEESLELWQKVLEMDGNYNHAYEGLASAYLQKGEYEKSMHYAELSYSQEIYNKAYEGFRRDFVKSHFGLIFSVIILSVVLLKKMRKKK
ncbi:MAG: hypothetical protein K2K91_02710 [Ruminococcus sp.]|nr:hypothetical protein [Ruminococcus sp.]